MKNVILEVAGTGGFVTLGAAAGFPNRARSVSIQARTNADVQYRWAGQTTYWTVKAGTVRTLLGEFWPGDLEVQAAGGVTIEIEISTQLTV